MFGEYAQVASFYDETGKDYYETDDSSYMPSYLLPKPKFFNPWSKPYSVNGDNCAEDEFILVAEFSELEGPKPLITIPTDGGQNFDKNNFSVKILSVDHQSTHRGFVIPEDTQIYITDEEERAFAFVHHFVLLDHEARGYVRPFCMAYVSHDSRKILENYESLSEQFEKAAKYFKYGNRLIFKRDCEQKLEDLRCTKDYLINVERLQSSKNGSNGENEDDAGEKDIHTSLKTIESLQNDFHVMLEKVSYLLNDRKMEERFQRMEGGRKTDKKIKGKSETDSCSLQDVDVCDRDVYKYGSFSEGYLGNNLMFWDPQKYKPTVLNLKQIKRFERTLRGLHELCFWGAKEALKFLRCVHECYSKDRETQEMQLLESSMINSLSSVLTFGNCAISNFMSGINMCEDDECFSSQISNKPCHKFINRILLRWPSTESFKSVQSFISIQDEECSLSSAKSSCGPTSTFDELYKRTENGIKESRNESGQIQNQSLQYNTNSSSTKINDIPNRDNKGSIRHECKNSQRTSHESKASSYENSHNVDSKFIDGAKCDFSGLSPKNDTQYCTQNLDLSDKDDSSMSNPSKDSTTSPQCFSTGKSSGITDIFYSAGSVHLSREDSMDRISDIISDSFHSIDSSSADELTEDTAKPKVILSHPGVDNHNSLLLTLPDEVNTESSINVSSTEYSSTEHKNAESCNVDVNCSLLAHNSNDNVKCNQNTSDSNIEDIGTDSNNKMNCSSNVHNSHSLCVQEPSHSSSSHITREKSPTSKLTLSLQAHNGISVQSTPKQYHADINTQYSINNDDTDEEMATVSGQGLTRVPLQSEEKENDEIISRNKKEKSTDCDSA